MNEPAFADDLEAQCHAPLSVSVLAQKHHAEFIRFLRTRVSGASTEAADVAQEAYIRMMRYEGSSKIRSPYFMLLRVAMNVVQDLRRAQQVRQRTLHRTLEGLVLVCNAPGPDRRLACAEELSRALAAIDTLSPRCREVFLMHRRDQLSYPEIARQCGISIKTVEKHISTALALCAERMSKDD